MYISISIGLPTVPKTDQPLLRSAQIGSRLNSLYDAVPMCKILSITKHYMDVQGEDHSTSPISFFGLSAAIRGEMEWDNHGQAHCTTERA
ncbi:hypothetical protein M378DRAFT_166207 [Amanita muscaria Koide BX008]|uniref:Uncharacterized protein n=1 Tax=Amanita muscaria (strain Koide BX008) TaxID=946122 RepID=A0A0C2SG47_AMAMK|nr:hypothetical protein M378DRAFT_166207 [Amanita muscaria Koide BX008]